MAIEWVPLLIGAAIGSAGSLLISWGFYIKAKQDSAAASEKLAAAIRDARRAQGGLSADAMTKLAAGIFETKAGKEIGGRILAKALTLYDQASKTKGDVPTAGPAPDATPPTN